MDQDVITLAAAQTIIADILSRAHAAGSKPLCVVITDAGGTPVAMVREDGAGLSRPKLSMDKAEGALAMTMPTRTLAQFYASNPQMHAILREATGKVLLPLAGGVSLDEEEGFAIAAIQSAGLVCEPAD